MRIVVVILALLFIGASDLYAIGTYRESRAYMRSLGGEYGVDRMYRKPTTTFATSNTALGLAGDICSGWTLFSQFEALVTNWSALKGYLKNAAMMAAKAQIEKMICTKSPLLCSILRGNKLLGMLNFYGDNKRCRDLINLSEDSMEKYQKEYQRECIRKAKAKGVQDEELTKCTQEGGFKLFGKWSTNLKNIPKNGEDLYKDYLDKMITNDAVGDFVKDTIGGLNWDASGSLSTQNTKKMRERAFQEVLREMKIIAKEDEDLKGELENDPDVASSPLNQKARFLKEKSKDPTTELGTTQLDKKSDGEPDKSDSQKKKEKEDALEALEIISPQLTMTQAKEIVTTLGEHEFDALIVKINAKKARNRVLTQLYDIRNGIYDVLVDPSKIKSPESAEHRVMTWKLHQVDAMIRELKYHMAYEEEYKLWLNQTVDGLEMPSRKVRRAIKSDAQSPGLETIRGVK